jgi:hypothetical protein
LTFIDRAEVEIERGENEGKTVLHPDRHRPADAGHVGSRSGAHCKLPLGRSCWPMPANGAVVMVQQENSGLPGPILGAASSSS